MRKMNLLIVLLTLASIQSPVVSSKSVRISNQPDIKIERAIEIAENYTVAKNIDTSKHYIDSVKLNRIPRSDPSVEFWEVKWEESQSICKGCYILIYVYMDGSAARIAAK